MTARFVAIEGGFLAVDHIALLQEEPGTEGTGHDWIATDRAGGQHRVEFLPGDHLPDLLAATLPAAPGTVAVVVQASEADGAWRARSREVAVLGWRIPPPPWSESPEPPSAPILASPVWPSERVWLRQPDGSLVLVGEMLVTEPGAAALPMAMRQTVSLVRTGGFEDWDAAPAPPVLTEGEGSLFGPGAASASPPATARAAANVVLRVLAEMLPAGAAMAANESAVPAVTRNQLRDRLRATGFFSTSGGALTAADRSRLRDALAALVEQGRITVRGEAISHA